MIQKKLLRVYSDSLAAFCIPEDSINCIRRMYPKVEMFSSRRFTRNVELGFLELFSQYYQIYFQPGFHDNLAKKYRNKSFTFTITPKNIKITFTSKFDMYLKIS